MLKVSKGASIEKIDLGQTEREKTVKIQVNPAAEN